MSRAYFNGQWHDIGDAVEPCAPTRIERDQERGQQYIASALGAQTAAGLADAAVDPIHLRVASVSKAALINHLIAGNHLSNPRENLKHWTRDELEDCHESAHRRTR